MRLLLLLGRYYNLNFATNEKTTDIKIKIHGHATVSFEVRFSLIICGRYVPLILDRDLDTKFAKPTKKDKALPYLARILLNLMGWATQKSRFRSTRFDYVIKDRALGRQKINSV
jgi:hypothetical protein